MDIVSRREGDGPGRTSPRRRRQFDALALSVYRSIRRHPDRCLERPRGQARRRGCCRHTSSGHFLGSGCGKTDFDQATNGLGSQSRKMLFRPSMHIGECAAGTTTAQHAFRPVSGRPLFFLFGAIIKETGPKIPEGHHHG